MKITSDRVGISWRPELGLEVLKSGEFIQAIEIMPEHLAHLSKRELATFKRLALSIPTMVHGVSLGLASAHAVDSKALDLMARIVDAIQPEAWSEHLAFVRIPGQELGHLAAPPWCEELVETTVRNIEVASQVVGTVPHLENIATLYSPPGSTLTETSWVSAIIRKSGSGLLLDVENVYANSLNFKHDAYEQISALPLESVTYIHIAGGSVSTDRHGTYFVDDHCNPVANEVFELLEYAASKIYRPLTVILERDGNFPPFSFIKDELSLAREALTRGRSKQVEEL